MKFIKKFIQLILITLTCSSVFSQNFRTGSTELDASLTIVNTNANSDIGTFRAQLKMEYNVSDGKLDYMSAKLKMSLAEIYFALEIGKYSRLSIDEVLVVYNKNKAHGWGVIAKECGIKPGSPEFHKLKNNVNEKAKKGKGHQKNIKDNKTNQDKNNKKQGSGKKGGKK